MTKKQEELVNKIRESALPQLGFGERHMDKYEIKEWEVEDEKFFVSVYLVVGMKNDEGTLAQAFARSRCHIFIYPKGKMVYPIYKKLKNGKWKSYYGNLNGKVDLLRVSVAQSF